MTDSLKSNVVVSQRGQVTLPAEVRKRLGIKEGGVLTLEERHGEIILRPAAVLEVAMYSDEDITRWDREDRLNNTERAAIRKKVSKEKS